VYASAIIFFFSVRFVCSQIRFRLKPETRRRGATCIFMSNWGVHIAITLGTLGGGLIGFWYVERWKEQHPQVTC
jgi:hypothetical protein